MTSTVSIKRRIAAILFDTVMVTIVSVVCCDIIDGFLEHTFLNLALKLILISIFLFVDALYLPRHTGFSISRWIFGYRIENTQGENPNYAELLKRFFSITTINIFTFSLAALFSIPFRKDHRAIHDIISGTVTKRISNSGLILPKILISLSVVPIYVAVLLKALSTDLNNVFFLPVDISNFEKSKNISTDFNSFPVDTGVVFNIKNNDILIYQADSFLISTNSTASDTFVVNNTPVKFVSNKTNQTQLILKESQTPLNFIYKHLIPRSWNSKNLFNFYYQTRFIPSKIKSISVLQPLQTYKFIVSGIFVSMESPKMYDCRNRLIQCGLIQTDSVVGWYKVYESINKKKINVLFYLYSNTFTYTINYNVPKENMNVALYLLRHTGIAKY